MRTCLGLGCAPTPSSIEQSSLYIIKIDKKDVTTDHVSCQLAKSIRAERRHDTLSALRAYADRFTNDALDCRWCMV